MPHPPRALAIVLLLLGLAAPLLTPGAARAQDAALVQIEAHRDAATARARAAEWARTLPGAAAWRLPSGWHAIVLGPYADAPTARAALTELRAAGLIPGDSYLTVPGDYLGPLEGSVADAPPAALAPPAAVAPPAVDAAGETLAEARAAERALDRDARAAIQTALAWFGHYTGAIDAAFGPGTRAAIAAWQTARGAEPTGVLRRAERAALLADWREDRDRLGLQEVTEAGLSIDLPLGMVRRVAVDPPFVRYEGADGLIILLLSQPGDALTLRAFYDIFQSLALIPATGPREIGDRSFSIEGRDGGAAAVAEAAVAGDWVKGWLVAWPAGSDQLMDRLPALLRDSFRPLPDAGLPRIAGPAPGADHLGGVAIRRPDRAASGVFVADDGAVLTLAANVAGCGRVTLDHDIPAEVAAEDGVLALLRPGTTLAPMAVATPGAVPPPGAALTLAGFPWGGRLPGAALNGGVLRDAAAPGAGDRLLVDVATEPGEAGAPLFAPDGRLAGLLAPPDGSRSLPPGTALAIPAGTAAAFLASAGVAVPAAAGPATPPDPQTLARQARSAAVLVSCWD
jgi:hypothetical protein